MGVTVRGLSRVFSERRRRRGEEQQRYSKYGLSISLLCQRHASAADRERSERAIRLHAIARRPYEDGPFYNQSHVMPYCSQSVS